MIKRRIKLVLAILMVLIMDARFTLPVWSAPSDDYSTYQFLPSPNYTQGDTKALLRIEGDDFGLPMHQVDWENSQGTTVGCQPLGGGGCTIHNEYDGLGTWIASTWEFYISGQQRPSGTYTAIVTYCTYVSFHSCIGSWVEMFRANFYISDVSVTYTTSGNAGVAGATLSYVDGTTKMATADGIGNYTMTVPSGWSGMVTPSKTDYLFSPTSRTYTNVLADETAQDYTAIAITSRIWLPLVIR
jgi:hypothetical protein